MRVTILDLHPFCSSTCLQVRAIQIKEELMVQAVVAGIADFDCHVIFSFADDMARGLAQVQVDGEARRARREGWSRGWGRGRKIPKFQNPNPPWPEAGAGGSGHREYGSMGEDAEAGGTRGGHASGGVKRPHGGGGVVSADDLRPALAEGLSRRSDGAAGDAARETAARAGAGALAQGAAGAAAGGAAEGAAAERAAAGAEAAVGAGEDGDVDVDVLAVCSILKLQDYADEATEEGPSVREAFLSVSLSPVCAVVSLPLSVHELSSFKRFRSCSRLLLLR